jgi:hypothetical protein
VEVRGLMRWKESGRDAVRHGMEETPLSTFG